MEPLHFVVAIVAGFLAGIINTLAGSGSLFTLPVLLFLGLSPHVANGTNRVGILLQTLVGAFTLYKRTRYKIGKDAFYIIPTVLGSIVGALIAVNIPENTLRTTIGIVMIVLLVIMGFNYNDLLRDKDAHLSKAQRWIAYPLLFAIGIYGGFIQLGVGIFTLTALVLVINLTFRHANALKNLMNFFLTLPAFLIFAFNNQIEWETGFTIAVGQATGAWFAARFAASHHLAGIWIRRLLIVMTVYTAYELLNVKTIVQNLF